MTKSRTAATTVTSTAAARQSPTGSPTSLIIPYLVQIITAIQSVTPPRLTGVLGLDGAKYQFWTNLPKSILATIKAKTEEANHKGKPSIIALDKDFHVLPSKSKKEDPNDPFDHRIYPWAIRDPDTGVLYRFGRKDSAHQHKIPNKSYEGQAPNIVAFVPAKSCLSEPDLRVHERRIYDFVNSLTGKSINSWQLERIDVAYDILGLDVEIPCFLRVAQACKLTTREGAVYGDAVGVYSGRKVTGFDSGRATDMRLNVYNKLHQTEKFKKSDPKYMQLLLSRWGQTADHVTRFEFQAGDKIWEALNQSKGQQPRTAASFYANLPWIMKFLMEDYYVFHDAPFDSTYSSRANVIWWWAEMAKAAQAWNGVLGCFPLTQSGLRVMPTTGSSMPSVREQIKQINTMRKLFSTFSKKNGFNTNDPEEAALVIDMIFKEKVLPNSREVAQCVHSLKRDREEFLGYLQRNVAWAFPVALALP